jgi:hypothetical protein
LENVERAIHAPGQTGRVIEQRPLHDANQVLKCARFAQLATERQPFVLRSTLAVHMRSLIMSDQKRARFNLRQANSFKRKKGRSKEQPFLITDH